MHEKNPPDLPLVCEHASSLALYESFRLGICNGVIVERV